MGVSGDDMSPTDLRGVASGGMVLTIWLAVWEDISHIMCFLFVAVWRRQGAERSAQFT